MYDYVGPADIPVFVFPARDNLSDSDISSKARLSFEILETAIGSDLYKIPRLCC